MSLDRRPADDECFDFHREYVAMVPDGDIVSTLTEQRPAIVEFIKAIPEGELEVVHRPYHWKVRTVLEHCCDAERVFGYRALRFATEAGIDLPGWDENHFATCGYGQSVPASQLAEEYSALRLANLSLLRRLRPETFNHLGTADGRKMSVRTVAWLMAGHWLHHRRILESRLQSKA